MLRVYNNTARYVDQGGNKVGGGPCLQDFYIKGLNAFANLAQLMFNESQQRQFSTNSMICNQDSRKMKFASHAIQLYSNL